MTPRKVTARTELAKRISEAHGLNELKAGRVVSSVIDELEKLLFERGRVEFRGWGTFQLVTRKARLGRNPSKPDEVYDVPARNDVKFIVGKELFGRLNRA